MDKFTSIIIPIHNSGSMLIDCIRSIQSSTNAPFEIILVESESTDGTSGLCDVLADDPRIRVFHTKKEGLVKAYNFGIKEAKGDYILLTQADVIFNKLYKTDWLVELIKVTEEKTCGIATCINGGGVSGEEYYKDMPWVGTWCMMIPRRTIDSIGILDEGFNPGIGDDIDYSYRVLKNNMTIGVCHFNVEHHRTGEHFCDNEELKILHQKYFKEKHKL